MEIPKKKKKKQAISYAIIAFENFLHSGNATDFNISIFEHFMIGTMGIYNKGDVVKYAHRLIENKKSEKNSIKKYKK